MISISFSGIKMFWLLGGGGLCPPDPLSYHYCFHLSCPHFSPPPPKNENMKRYAYAEMPSVRFFCGSAHRHLIIRKYRHFIRCILFPNKVYIVSDFSYTEGQFTTPDPLSYHYCFHLSCPHFSPPPPKNENMKGYAYAEMPSVRFFCGSAYRHLIIRKFRHFIRCILFPTSVILKVNL